MNIELKKLIDASKALDKNAVSEVVTLLLERQVVLKDNWLGVARVCMSVGNYSLAKQSIERLVGECQELPTVLQGLGILSDCGETVKAYEIGDSMLKQNPSLVPIKHTKGVLAYQMGKLEEAKSLFYSVVGKFPLAGEAWHMLSTLADTEEEYISIRKELENLKPSVDKLPNNTAKATFYNALANVTAHVIDNDAALDNYKACAKVMGALVQNNPLPFTSIDTFNNAVRELPNNESKHNGTTPIFVLGLPRSGTTLLTQLLCVNPEIASVGEADTFSLACDLVLKERRSLEHPETLLGVTDTQISEIASMYITLCGELAGDAQFIVDKSLSNLQYVALLQRVFPDAIYIYTERERCANAWSIFRTFFSKGMEWTWNASSIAQVVEKAQHYANECAEKDYGKVFRIQINELSSTPEDLLTPIFSALGLTYTDNHDKFYLQKDAVKTASMSQIRRPLAAATDEKQVIPKRFVEELDTYLHKS